MIFFKGIGPLSRFFYKRKIRKYVDFFITTYKTLRNQGLSCDEALENLIKIYFSGKNLVIPNPNLLKNNTFDTDDKKICAAVVFIWWSLFFPQAFEDNQTRNMVKRDLEDYLADRYGINKKQRDEMREIEKEMPGIFD